MRVWSTAPISFHSQRKWEGRPQALSHSRGRLSADMRGKPQERPCPGAHASLARPGSEVRSPAQPPAWFPAQGVGGPELWQLRPLHLYQVPLFLLDTVSRAFRDGVSLPRSTAFPHREEQALSPPMSPCPFLVVSSQSGSPCALPPHHTPPEQAPASLPGKRPRLIQAPRGSWCFAFFFL